MYLILIIFYISITATGQKLEASGNKSTNTLELEPWCFITDYRQDRFCIDLDVCPQTQPYHHDCILENNDNLLCCPDRENEIIKPSVEYVDRDMSNRKIINMCYNYYADRTDDGSWTCTFDDNCMFSTCRENQFPPTKHIYTARLGWRQDNDAYDFENGAFLVTRYFLITSAHSVERGHPDIVRLEDEEFSRAIPSLSFRFEQDIKVNDVYIHPEYKPLLAYNDIAIVKLAEEADERFILYCLWTDDDDFVPEFLATGTGYTADGGFDLKIFFQLNKTTCNSQFSDEPRLPNGIIDSQFCAFDPEANMDNCEGDLGGPLFTELYVMIKPECKISNIRYIMGISSDGVCGEPFSGVYTKMSSYLDWIDSIIYASSPPKIEFTDNEPTVNMPCLLRATGQYGVCVNINNCTHAISALHKMSPQYCFIQENQHIVCCPNDEKISTKVVKRHFSKNKIINMCYNHHFNTSFNMDGILDENCIFQKYPNIARCKNCDGLGHPSAGGGVPVHISEHMYMASLGWRRDIDSFEFQCGAVLVARNFVLTAAHCMKGGNPDIVRLGDKIYKPMYSQDVNIIKIFIHPKYVPTLNYNDIAIVKLATEAKKQFVLVCLWMDDDNLAPDLRAIGYGATYPDGPTSDVLYQVSLQLMNYTVCNEQFSGHDSLPTEIISSQLCAGDPERKMDTCKGDSGGPLFTKINLVFAPECTENPNVAHIVGITSFGQVCTQSLAGVYTRVSSYLDWIDSIIFGN